MTTDDGRPSSDLPKSALCVMIMPVYMPGRAFRLRRGPEAIPWKGGYNRPCDNMN